MFNIGDIVCHDNIVFNNNMIDTKINRPCIFLFGIKLNDIGYACTCPIISGIESFNKHKGAKHYLISQPIIKYETLSFAKTDNLLIIPMEETYRYDDITLNNHDLENIIDKICHYNYNTNIENYLKNYLNTLKISKKELERLEKQKRKQLRKEKIKQAKRSI